MISETPLWELLNCLPLAFSWQRLLYPAAKRLFFCLNELISFNGLTVRDSDVLLPSAGFAQQKIKHIKWGKSANRTRIRTCFQFESHKQQESQESKVLLLFCLYLYKLDLKNLAMIEGCIRLGSASLSELQLLFTVYPVWNLCTARSVFTFTFRGRWWKDSSWCMFSWV